jgi:hypothetical protein
VNDKSILSSAIEPPADAPGFCEEDAAKAAKIRRRKRQSKKNFVVSYNSYYG